MTIASFLWKTIPKKYREGILACTNPINQYPLNKFLSGNFDLPKDFIELNCIFIHVPKCAGTTVKNTLFSREVHGHMPLWFYEKCFPEFYQRAYKFTFVRNPLDRAYSAFCYASNSNLSRNSNIKEVTKRYTDFDSFVKNWMSHENIQKHILFNPQVDFLKNSIGLVDMNFIGKQESFDKDFIEVTTKLGKFERAGIYNTSVREVSPNFHTQTIDKIYDLYYQDFEVFGYGRP